MDKWMRRAGGGLLVVLLQAAVWAAPPKVVEVIPAADSEEVDPTLTRIIVRFDRAMSRASYSVVGGGPQFPEIVASRFTSDRTFEMTVRLKPSWDYVLQLNGGRFQNFRSADGVPLEPFTYRFRTRAAATTRTAADIAEANRRAVIALRTAIDRSYSYKADRKVDWDGLFLAHQHELQVAPDAASFARVAGTMLAVCADAHIWLVAEGRTFASVVRDVPPNIRFAAYRHRLGNVEQLGPDTLIATLDGTIPYIVIGRLTAQVLTEEVLNRIDRVIQEADPSVGLILDIRPNGGGDERLAQRLAGRFVSDPVVYARHQMVNDPTIHPRTMTPAATGQAYAGKVAVLIGPRVMSSAESFVLMLKQAPAARTFGETTAGSSGNPKPHDLGNGVTVFLPSWRDLNADGSLREGRGIEPDQFVQLGEDAGRDDVLEAAVKWLK